MERFVKIVNSWKPLTIFIKILLLICLAGFWIRLSSLQHLILVLIFLIFTTLSVTVAVLEIPKNLTCSSYFKLLFQFIKRRRPQQMFSLACNLLKKPQFPVVWSNLLKKSVMENFIFCAVQVSIFILTVISMDQNIRSMLFCKITVLKIFPKFIEENLRWRHF